MTRSNTGNSIQRAVIISICVLLGLIMVYICLPISTTKLIDDVGQYNDAYKGAYVTQLGIDFENRTLQNYKSQNKRQQVVDIAMSQNGTKEGTSYNNQIKYNDWYSGTGSSSPYCAIFTMWCFNEAGMYKRGSNGPPIIDSASCTSLALAYNKLGRFVWATEDYEPRPGDLVLYSKGSGANKLGRTFNHIGIVVNTDEDHIYTVEGNTSPSVSEDQDAGDGVWTKIKFKPGHGDTTVSAYCIPWYVGDEEFMAVDGKLF